MRKISLLLVLLLLPTFCVLSSCDKETARTTYEIDCELKDNLLSGREKITFLNQTDNAFTSLKFNLFANAFRKGAKYSPISLQYTSLAYYDGINYGDMKISRVYSEKNLDLKFEIVGEDDNILQVFLEEEIFPSESVTVIIDYSITLAKVVARTGITKKSINLANFYPVLCGIESGAFYECLYYANGDPYFSDVADYKVKFTCNEEFVVASSGKIVEAEKAGNKSVNTYVLDNARSFALTLSKGFEHVSEKVEGVEISYYYYEDETPNDSLQTAVKSFKYFTSVFGEYPYPTYSVVQTEFVQGGMEFPALVMISDDLERPSYHEVIVHETAHQWWQTVVGNNEIEYGFLDEGLAEYSVVLFYENHPEYGVNRRTLVESSEKTYKTFCSVYEKLFGNVNTSMLRSLGEFSGEYEYVNLAYIKPCIMYDNLRKTVGDEIFFKALKKYYENNAFTNVVPDQLVAEFEKQVKDVSGYFYSFFDGKAII